MLDWKAFKERFPMIAHALANAKSAGRMGHAYLVASANPNYRVEFPTLLSALRVCLQQAPDGGPCMDCRECRNILNGLYPDLYLLAPTSKAREIVIGKDSDDPDTLRWFESQFHLSSVSESGWKIGVVQEADTMNESAQNAFLKTLEEPPGKCLFILTTGRPSSLLPTVRSRCQLLSLTDNRCEYSFPRCADVPPLLSTLALAPKPSLMRTEDCARALIEIAASLSTAARTAADEKWAPRLEAAKELEAAGVKLIERRIDGEAGSEYRRSREQFISLIHTWFAQLVLMTSGMENSLFPNPELLPPPESVKDISGDKALRMLTAAEDLLSAMRTNVNDELALRTFCLSINFILTKD